MKLIGLTGPAGAGKDTVAAFLSSLHNFDQFALADPIRFAIMGMFGLSITDMNNRQAKEMTIDWIGKSPRQLMQTLGTEWGRRHVADDIWLRIAARKIETFHAANQFHDIPAAGIVVTDIRFENEAAWLRGQGGQLWHIHRPNATCLAGESAQHASEAGVTRQPGDIQINNLFGFDVLGSLVAEALGDN